MDIELLYCLLNRLANFNFSDIHHALVNTVMLIAIINTDQPDLQSLPTLLITSDSDLYHLRNKCEMIYTLVKINTIYYLGLGKFNCNFIVSIFTAFRACFQVNRLSL